MKNTIGIIGGGFVGSATAWGFGSTHEVKIYDVNPKVCQNTLEEVCKCDFVFICVPTPPNKKWQVDLSILESVIYNCKKYVSTKSKIVIKSTVPPGTCKRLSKTFGLEILSNPEFLTERRAKWDFLNAAQILIGAEKKSSAESLKNLYEQRFNSMKYTITDTVTSELIKYTLNSFFSTKVIFMNEIHDICNHVGGNWKQLIEGFTSDSRVSDSHTDVPGPDGKYGFGGKCFPKDLNGLKNFAKDLNIDTTLLDAVWKKNTKLRKN